MNLWSPLRQSISLDMVRIGQLLVVADTILLTIETLI